MNLALNNLQSLICHKTQTTPNLSGATILGQSGPGSDGNKEILRIPQSSSITEASPSDSLVSYPRHSLGEIQLFCSAAPADKAMNTVKAVRNDM